RKLVHGTSSLRSARQKTSYQIDSSFVAICDDDEGKGFMPYYVIFLDQECEELRIKCEEAMIDFDKNPNVVALCKKIITLQGEKVRVESIEASLHQKLENAKRDRADVVSNVVLNVATKLVQSDDMGKLVAKLVNASIFYG
nr:hypothetical protein [Tanacetum cinerariifolium]